MRRELDELNAKVARLFLTTMSPSMYTNLKKLASGSFGTYEMNKGLDRELHHLRDIGYIDIHSIKAIPGSGTNLSEHVEVTATGKQFVDLRESVAQQTAAA